MQSSPTPTGSTGNCSTCNLLQPNIYTQLQAYALLHKTCHWTAREFRSLPVAWRLLKPPPKTLEKISCIKRYKQRTQKFGAVPPKSQTHRKKKSECVPQKSERNFRRRCKLSMIRLVWPSAELSFLGIEWIDLVAFSWCYLWKDGTRKQAKTNWFYPLFFQKFPQNFWMNWLTYPHFLWKQSPIHIFPSCRKNKDRRKRNISALIVRRTLQL